tara:strand:- start:22 stop:492 length:471 start_codon:yes stop_codon:yes gene_type:complete
MINLLGKVVKMGNVLETLSDIKESGDNFKIAKIEAEKEILIERIRDKKAFDLEILNQKKDKVDGAVLWSVLICGILTFIPTTSTYLYLGWHRFMMMPEVFQIAVIGLLCRAFGGRRVWDMFMGLSSVLGKGKKKPVMKKIIRRRGRPRKKGDISNV